MRASAKRDRQHQAGSGRLRRLVASVALASDPSAEDGWTQKWTRTL
jgi:hypothetical protein